MTVAEEAELVENRPPAVRRSYELKEKRFVVQQIDALISSGHSRCNACQILGIPPLYYRRWKRLVLKVHDVNSTDDFVSYNTKGTARKIHPGRPSALLADVGGAHYTHCCIDSNNKRNE